MENMTPFEQIEEQAGIKIYRSEGSDLMLAFADLKQNKVA